MRKETTLLTTAAVITVAWIGIYITPVFDQPDDPTDAPPPTHSSDESDLPRDQIDDVDDRGQFDPAEPASTGSEAMTVDAALSHPMLHLAGDDEIHAEFVFEATDEVPEARAPLNLALVVDRSGSMRQEPIEQARRAARAFVEQLQPQDRVTLVTFDHEIIVDVESTHVDEEGKPLLLDAIDNIHPGGATNISGALRAGFDEVETHQDPEMVDRIILMTDGIPNRGITNDEKLAAKTGEIRRSGVTTTALGFGPNYDAELLANMAVEGAGNFRHIDDAADLEEAFVDELQNLQATVASGIHLDLYPGEGVEIGDVYGFSQDDIDGGTRISLGNLETDGRRSAVIELHPRDIDASSGDLRDIIDAEVDYIDRLEGNDHRRALQLAATTTGSVDDVDDHVDSDVMLRVEEHRSLQSLSEVRQHRERGDQQAARERIEREQERLQQLRESYESNDSARSSEGSRSVDRLERLFDDEQQDASPESPDFEAADAPSQADEVQMDIRQGRGF